MVGLRPSPRRGPMSPPRQALGGLSGMTLDALGMALAHGGVALGRRVPSAISRVLTRLPLLEPTQPPSLRLMILGGRLTPIAQPLTMIRDVVTLVGGPLSRVGDRVALIRYPVTLIRGLLAPVRHLLELVGDPRSHPRRSFTAPLVAQPRALTLQRIVVGLELRGTLVDPRAEALDLIQQCPIRLLQGAGSQLPQIGPIRVDQGKLALQCGAAPLELGPVRIASCFPHGSRGFIGTRSSISLPSETYPPLR